MYPMFPRGWPAVALLLMRASATIGSIVSAGGAFHSEPNWHLMAMIPLCAAFCVGLLTPLVAVLAVGVQLVAFISARTSALWLSVTILNTLALAMLGPGAYSIDAQLFGRRLLLTNRDE
jgi:uncharacterized membrane protein YphA (DoxX/SURF4 family)